MQSHTGIEGNEIANELAKKGAYLVQDAASNLTVPFKEVKSSGQNAYLSSRKEQQNFSL